MAKLVSDWFKTETKNRKTTIGLANGGLRLIEIFRTRYPLQREDYVSSGGTQVKGLSGRSGDRVIARFMPGMRPLGTEAGRTSRGTLPAIGRLANALNKPRPEIEPLGAPDRERLADAMQRWLIENPIRTYFAAHKLQPSFDPRNSSAGIVTGILEVAGQRNQAGQVAQHIIGAKLALRFPKENIGNYSYSTADVPTGRAGDFHISSTVFHVTTLMSRALLNKCRQNIRNNYRVLVLVPHENHVGAVQLIKSEGLSERVTVVGIESFVGQNIEELGGFAQVGFERQLRRLFELYNERVAAIEPDPSLQIDIPAKLGSA